MDNVLVRRYGSRVGSEKQKKVICNDSLVQMNASKAILGIAVWGE